MTGSNLIQPSSQRGFALLVAIVLSTVAVSITLALTSIAYKGLLLSSSARESQYAFYAADTALECALYWDNRNQNRFIYGSGQASGVSCAAVPVTMPASTSGGTTKFESAWFTVNGSDCAKITVYKSSTGATNLFGTGVNVACTDLTNPRAVERGLKAFY